MIKDLWYSLRALTKSWLFAATSIFTLALGIGINTTTFSIVNAVLLKPLPFPNSEKIVRISQTYQSGALTRRGGLSAPEVMDYEQSNRSLGAVSAFQERSFTLSMGDHAALVWGARTSPEIFRVLGIFPERGRKFLPPEAQPGHDNVAIVGHRFWQQYFGGDAEIIGKQIILDAKPYTIVGIMPPAFYAIDGQRENYLDEVLVPLAFDHDELAHRDARDFDVVGRLKSNVGIADARAESVVLGEHFKRSYPDVYPESQRWALNVQRARDYVIGNTRPVFLLLWAAAGLVLLIACSNVASLLLGRVLNRQSEFAVRAALGASSVRLLRLVLVETSILSIVGCGIGLALSLGSFRIFRALKLFNALKVEDLLQQSAVDWPTLWFAIAVAVFTALAAGAAPCFRILRKSFWEALKQAESRQTSSSSRLEVRKTLAVTQIAIAVVLVACAGLTLTSFVNLQHENLGFNPDNVLTTWISLPEIRYSSPGKQIAFFDQVLNKVVRLPGVASASVANYPVFFGEGPHVCFVPAGAAPPAGGRCPEALFRIVSPGYFQTLQIPVKSGRIFRGDENATDAPVFLINETLAEQYFHQHSPLSAGLSIGGAPGDSLPRTNGSIIGVVGDTRYDPVEDKSLPEVYMSFLQSPVPWGNLWVRTKVAPQGLISAIAREVWAVDKDQPLYVPPGNVTLSDLVSRQQAYERLLTTLFSIFAGLALFMATIGVYALSYFSVSQRLSEFGIRMALGAQPSHILRIAIAYGLRLVGIGITIGLLIAYSGGNLLRSVLYHVQPADPLILGAVVVLLGGIAGLACYIPARRATTIDPLLILKER